MGSRCGVEPTGALGTRLDSDSKLRFRARAAAVTGDAWPSGTRRPTKLGRSPCPALTSTGTSPVPSRRHPRASVEVRRPVIEARSLGIEARRLAVEARNLGIEARRPVVEPRSLGIEAWGSSLKPGVSASRFQGSLSKFLASSPTLGALPARHSIRVGSIDSGQSASACSSGCR